MRPEETVGNKLLSKAIEKPGERFRNVGYQSVRVNPIP